ncbi:MAG: aminomethyltransferase family protein [Actinomycetes bacterium]
MSSGEQLRSALYEVQARQGATFEDFDGAIWTMDLGDTPGEYEAIRTGGAMWDVYALVKWTVEGSDAARALQRVFTNDVGSMSDGQVRYGGFTDAEGNLLDEGTVYRRGAGHYYAFTNTDSFGAHLAEHSAGLDVVATNETAQMPLISVQGPRSREVLQGLTGTDLSSLRYFRFLTERVEVAGIPVLLSRTGFSGELGFEMIPDRENAEPLWLALAEVGVTPIGFHAVEMARVEAGLIVFGYDYEPGTRSPFDVGLDAVVALGADADFLGRDALAAVAAAPPNRFKTLRIDSPDAPEYGSDVTLDGEVVGTLTSPSVSPRLGTIGLAVLRSDVAANGNTLAVSVGGTTVTAVVDELSLYDPQKRRPRS